MTDILHNLPQVMSGIAPYGSMSDAKALMMVVIGTLPSPADHPLVPADASLWDLMRRCWEFEPNSRPTMREVVEAVRLFDAIRP